MNTTEPQDDKGGPVGRRAKVIHNYEKRSVSGNAALLARGAQRAKELGYEGGFSGYVCGLILFDLVMQRPHWLTVDAVNDPEALEGMLAELKERPPAEWKALFEHMLERIKEAKPKGEI